VSFDIIHIIGAIWGFIGTVVRLIGIAKPMLDSTKTGLEIIQTGRKIIDEAPEPKPEQVPERLRALAEVLRSFSLIALAEVLLWMFRGFFLLGMFRLWIEWRKIEIEGKKKE
jgi:hypothetical protein